MRSLRLVAWLLMVTSALVTSLWAQSFTSLHGTIQDPKGAVIAGATVTLINPQVGYSRTTKTDGQGVYQFAQVLPTMYMLTVSAPGFATIKESNVVLQVSTPATINFTLEVQATSVTIEVTGVTPAVNTSDATQGNTFSGAQLIDLPSEGRNAVAILSLQPGVTFVGNVDQTADSRSGAVSGARSDQTNVMLDGLDNNDQLNGFAFTGALRAPLDSLQEFRVTTTNSNADTGRSSGAQINLVTKSGTNSFHGAVYEYHRPTFTTANDWLNKHSQLQNGEPNRPGKLVRNTFGATIGGPIKKDRLLFFAAYEGKRQRESPQTLRTLPSEFLRQRIVRYRCDVTDPNC